MAGMPYDSCHRVLFLHSRPVGLIVSPDLPTGETLLSNSSDHVKRYLTLTHLGLALLHSLWFDCVRVELLLGLCGLYHRETASRCSQLYGSPPTCDLINGLKYQSQKAVPADTV